ncbi:Hsp20/alpha crystallin family protein [Arthrobacter sp. TMS2-4]
MLPDGVKDEDIRASYTDGVLDVRTPLPDDATRCRPSQEAPHQAGLTSTISRAGARRDDGVPAVSPRGKMRP